MKWYLGSILTFSASIAQAGPLCIAHRGDSESEIGNSLESFRSAISKGADGFELDVWQTRDGVPLVHHDETLRGDARSKANRSCPLDLPIRKITFKDIRESCEFSDGQEILVLSEVFEAFQSESILIQLDLKVPPLRATVDMIRRFSREGRPQLVALLSLRDAIFKVGTLRRRLGIPTLHTNRVYQAGVASFFDGVDVVDISDEEVRTLQKRGKRISLYGLETEEQLRRAYNLNADMLVTGQLALCHELQRSFSPTARN